MRGFVWYSHFVLYFSAGTVEVCVAMTSLWVVKDIKKAVIRGNTLQSKGENVHRLVQNILFSISGQLFFASRWRL